jgi:hypothetical protein
VQGGVGPTEQVPVSRWWQSIPVPQSLSLAHGPGTHERVSSAWHGATGGAGAKSAAQPPAPGGHAGRGIAAGSVQPVTAVTRHVKPFAQPLSSAHSCARAAPLQPLSHAMPTAITTSFPGDML